MTAAAPPIPDTSTPLPPRRVVVVFSGLVLAVLLGALDSTIVATALPTIVGEMGGIGQLSWVVTAYLLAQTVVTPLYGKLGDLYGRKKVLQIAIVIFLLGSVLCGASRTLGQLIAFRALQGLGGGGLIVTSQAVIGDVIAPRDRGRYQGIFGAVFGVSSIVGPLVGGFFTTQLSWRWIFYINLPLGVIALVVLAATLPAQGKRTRRTIDYFGAATLAVVLSALTLISDLGGTTFPWSSPFMIGLAISAVIALALFIIAERRAEEPILPLHLFGNRAFVTATTVGLIVGFALFGSVTYLPVYLQVVKGATPTASGLQMLPMMLGTLVSSVASGQAISRTGRYKIFPIVGTAVVTVGLYLLSGMTAETPTWAASASMLLLGLGLGLVMQVLVLAVQNSVEYRDLGVATSGAILFRLVGGSLGAAVLGAVLNLGLQQELARLLSALGGASPGAPLAAGLGPGALDALQPDVRAAYAQAFTESLNATFTVATAVALLGFALIWMLPEHQLRATVAGTARAVTGELEVFPMPVDTDSISKVLRGLSVLDDRRLQRRYLERVVREAGSDVKPVSAWLLMRLADTPTADPATIGKRAGVDPSRLRVGVRELQDRGLIARTTGNGARPARWRLSREGHELLDRLLRARRNRVEEIFAEWDPAHNAEVAELERRFLRELEGDGRGERGGEVGEEAGAERM